MQTAMAGLVEAQSDMLTALAEEVDRLQGERDEAFARGKAAHEQAEQVWAGWCTDVAFERGRADRFERSAAAGWTRAHALRAELTTVRKVLETVKHDREKFMYSEAELKAQLCKLYPENEDLRRELAARDQALAEATAAIERLRAREGAAVDRLLAMGWRA